MSVYVIASLTIKDAVRFEDYRRMLLPTMAKYGARLVARGVPIVLEGEAARTANHRRVSQHGADARVVGLARIRRAKGAAPSHG
jgi:Domain of unknown function (DUF1330)